MRGMLIVGILLLVLGIAVIAGTLFMMNTKDQVLDGSGMINPNSVDTVVYYYGGGELGDFYRLTLESDNTLNREKCDGNGSENEEKTIKLSSDFFEEIEEEIFIYALRRAKNLPQSDIEILDGAHSSLTIRFTDGEEVSINTDKHILSDNQREGFNKIVDMLEQAAGDGK